MALVTVSLLQSSDPMGRKIVSGNNTQNELKSINFLSENMAGENNIHESSTVIPNNNIYVNVKH